VLKRVPFVDQILRVPSSLADAIMDPSGEQATPVILAECPPCIHCGDGKASTLAGSIASPTQTARRINAARFDRIRFITT